MTSFAVDLITFSSRNNTKLSRERICSLGFFVCRQFTLISEECSWSGEIRTTDRNLLLLLLLFFYLFLFVFLRHWTEKPIMIIKHLMTGPEGNSEFCFPETLNEVEGKQNSLFPIGPVIKCFVIPPNSMWNNTLMSAYDLLQNATNPNNLHIK